MRFFLWTCFSMAIICTVLCRHLDERVQKYRCMSNKIEILSLDMYMIVISKGTENFIFSPFGGPEILDFTLNASYLQYQINNSSVANNNGYNLEINYGFLTNMLNTGSLQIIQNFNMFDYSITTAESNGIKAYSYRSVHKDGFITITFNAKWQEPFSVYSTTPRIFHSTPNNVLVQMMNMESYFDYGSIPNIPASFIEIPLKDNFSMLVVLPDSNSNLDAVEDRLSRLTITELTRNRTSRYIDLELPKFKFSAKLEFFANLTETSFHSLFNETNDNYKVEQVVYIEVNESGITDESEKHGVSFLPVSISSPFKYHVNRPFHFKIIKRLYNTPTIIFVGSVKKFK